MTIAQWPLSLPVAPRVSDLQETAPDLVLRTEMDAGPAKARRRTTYNVSPLKVSMAVTGAQLADFVAFYGGAAAGGAEPFLFKHPRTGGVVTCRFTGKPTWSPLAPRDGGAEYWTIQFELEEIPSGTSSILPPPTPPDYTTLIGTTGTHTFSHASSIEADLVSCCFSAGDFTNFVPVTRTFAYARTTLSGTIPVAVVWEYVASGQTSTITYSRDAGWSYVLSAAHFGVTDCPTSVPFRPTSNTEAGGIRHLGIAEIVTGGTGPASPALLCPGTNRSTVDWFKSVDALLNNSPRPDPVARALGFADYAAICRTTTSGGGGGGGPIDDTVGGGIDTDTGVVSP